MMFGMYAKYFQEQNPKEGEFLTLVNPQSCDLWQFPGNENSGIFLKFEIGPLLHTRVCLHPFYPQIPLIRTEIAEKTDDYVKQISINPNMNRKRSATIIDKKKKKLIYTPLKDCVPSKGTKYNAWCVIKKINFFPRPTKRGGLFSLQYFPHALSSQLKDSLKNCPTICFKVFDLLFSRCKFTEIQI